MGYGGITREAVLKVMSDEKPRSTHEIALAIDGHQGYQTGNDLQAHRVYAELMKLSGEKDGQYQVNLVPQDRAQAKYQVVPAERSQDAPSSPSKSTP